MVDVRLPRPTDVGVFYDWLAEYSSYSSEFTGNFHFGYWDEGAVDNPVDTLQRASDRLTDLMIEKIKAGPGMRVLDVGCGYGGPAVRLARATQAEVVGITISDEQVKLATAHAEAMGMRDLVSFRKADAMDLPFDDASFDAAWALESIIHMPDRSAVTSEVNRVVRPGGRFVLTDMFERAPIPDVDRELVDQMLKSFMMGPLPTAEDYPALMRAGGMWLYEFLDITEETVRNTLIAWDQVWGSTLTRKPDFWDSFPPYDGAKLADVVELGYLLAVAKVNPCSRH